MCLGAYVCIPCAVGCIRMMCLYGLYLYGGRTFALQFIHHHMARSHQLQRRLFCHLEMLLVVC